jgi:tetratricopeptide (TPR) repeat protein
MGAETVSASATDAASRVRAGLKPGDKVVVARSGAKFKFSGRTIATLDPGTEMTVGSIGPDWIAGFVILQGTRTPGYLDTVALLPESKKPSADSSHLKAATSPAANPRPTATPEPALRPVAHASAAVQAEEHYERGLACDRLGDHDRAIAEYNEAIRLDPKCARVYPKRGVAYSKMGDFDRAIADFTAALQSDPKSAATLVDRAAAYNKKGDYDRAIADCTAALELEPQSALAYANRGFAYKGKGDLDRAIVDCTEAIRLDPYHARAHYTRALAWASKGDQLKADADFAAAKRLGYRPAKPGVE